MITKNNIQEFKKCYNEALKNNQEIFIFEEQEILVTYAKYLIEYLDMKIKQW